MNELTESIAREHRVSWIIAFLVLAAFLAIFWYITPEFRILVKLEILRSGLYLFF